MKHEPAISQRFLERARKQADGLGGAPSGPGPAARFFGSAKSVLGALVVVGVASGTAYIVKETRENTSGASLASLNCGSAHAAWWPGCSNAPGAAPASPQHVAAADRPRTAGAGERNAKKRSSSPKGAKKTEIAAAPPVPPATAGSPTPDASPAPQAKTGEPVRTVELAPLPAPPATPPAQPSADLAKPDPAKTDPAKTDLTKNRVAQAPEADRAASATTAAEPRLAQEQAKLGEARPRRALPNVTETGTIPDKPVAAEKAPATAAARWSDPGPAREAAPPSAQATPSARNTAAAEPAAEQQPASAPAGERSAPQPVPALKAKKLARSIEAEKPPQLTPPETQAVSPAPKQPNVLASAEPAGRAEDRPPAPSISPREPAKDEAGAAKAEDATRPTEPVPAKSTQANAAIEPAEAGPAATSESDEPNVKNPAIATRRKALRLAAQKAAAEEKAEARAEARVEARRTARLARRAAIRRARLARAEEAAERAEAVAARRRAAAIASLRERRRARIAARAPQRLVKYRLVRLRIVESGVIPGHSFPPEFAQALRQYNTGYRAEPAYGPLPW
jgi:hypothetical protein